MLKENAEQGKMQMGEEMQGSPVSGQRVCVPGVRVCVCARVRGGAAWVPGGAGTAGGCTDV